MIKGNSSSDAEIRIENYYCGIVNHFFVRRDDGTLFAATMNRSYKQDFFIESCHVNS